MAIKDEVRPVSIDAPDARTPDLFLVEDLEDPGRTKNVAETDLKALRAVADWTRTFVAKPNKDLGRSGPVCPFTVLALEHKTLWLAAERSAGRSRAEVTELINGYKRMLLANQPVRGDLASNRTIMVVFTDCRRPRRRTSSVEPSSRLPSHLMTTMG